MPLVGLGQLGLVDFVTGFVTVQALSSQLMCHAAWQIQGQPSPAVVTRRRRNHWDLL